MSAAFKRLVLRLVALAGADPDRAVGWWCIAILAALPMVLGLPGGAV